MSKAAEDKLVELNTTYQAFTGEDAFLYASHPTDTTTRYVFSTSPTVFTNVGEALAHMQHVLEKANAGWTHDEIVYGKERKSEHTVNRGAW